MSKKAEIAALKAYPVEMIPLVYQDLIDQFGGKTEIDVNTYPRCIFQSSYEQAEKDLGWISVNDRLPEENKWVFVCVDMQGVPQCVGLGYLKDGEWCDDENDNGFCVDYWMEIPALPKEEEK